VPPEGLLIAALRWLRLLNRGATVLAATEILLHTAKYTDLTRSQYASGLEWLRNLELVPADGTHNLPGSAADIHASVTLFRTVIALDEPVWLQDADLLVRAPAELPEDALSLAETLELGDIDAVGAIRHVHRRLDLERRNEIGALGEQRLAELLETAWPASVEHVSQHDDGLGYDIELYVYDCAWKLEVKSTTRKGRMRVFLSRNEFETGMVRADWRLVVLRLGADEQIDYLGTVPTAWIGASVPKDHVACGRWESASLELTPDVLAAGLPFVAETGAVSHPLLLQGTRRSMA
jgi:Domain of unknown function (DUF3883)